MSPIYLNTILTHISSSGIILISVTNKYIYAQILITLTLK